jgi:hypothetical protein
MGSSVDFPSDEELERRVQAEVEAMNLSDLLHYRFGTPACPTDPGLYALVAPDGVTVRVVPGRTDYGDLRKMIFEDITRRLLRSFYEEKSATVLRGDPAATFESFYAGANARHLRWMTQYRVEKLG